MTRASCTGKVHRGTWRAVRPATGLLAIGVLVASLLAAAPGVAQVSCETGGDANDTPPGSPSSPACEGKIEGGTADPADFYQFSVPAGQQFLVAMRPLTEGMILALQLYRGNPSDLEYKDVTDDGYCRINGTRSGSACEGTTTAAGYWNVGVAWKSGTTATDYVLVIIVPREPPPPPGGTACVPSGSALPSLSEPPTSPPFACSGLLNSTDKKSKTYSFDEDSNIAAVHVVVEPAPGLQVKVTVTPPAPAVAKSDMGGPAGKPAVISEVSAPLSQIGYQIIPTGTWTITIEWVAGPGTDSSYVLVVSREHL